MILGVAGSSSSRSVAQETCTWKIGFLGALTGDYAHYGTHLLDALELAVDQTNEDGDLACDLAVVAFDSQGDPRQAQPGARSLRDDEEVVACICGVFSGETLATGHIFERGGLAQLSLGTNTTIRWQDFDHWFRVVASDAAEAHATGSYIARNIDPTRVALVYDTQYYGRHMARRVAETLGDDVRKDLYVINPNERDHSAVAVQIKDRPYDAVYYGGYVGEAGRLLRQLRDAGVSAPYFTDSYAKTRVFARLVKDAAESAEVSCACSDPTEIDRAAVFVEEFRETYEKDPRPLAADVYDVANIVIDSLRELDGSETRREARDHVIAHLDAVEGYPGTIKDYTWTPEGELAADEEHVFMWLWDRDEGFSMLGRISELD